jgi:hypothetical protein
MKLDHAAAAEKIFKPTPESNEMLRGSQGRAQQRLPSRHV